MPHLFGVKGGCGSSCRPGRYSGEASHTAAAGASRISGTAACFGSNPGRFAGIIEVVGKTKELAQRLEEAERQLRLFQSISRFMVKDLSLSEVLHGIVSLINDSLICDSCLIYLVHGDELVLCASSSYHPAAIGAVRLRVDEGLTGWVARERRLLAISREAYNDPRFKFFQELPEDTYEAILSAPVVARNRVVGVINIQHRLPHSHSGSEMELLKTIGEQVGCLLLLAQVKPEAVQSVRPVDLVLASQAM